MAPPLSSGVSALPDVDEVALLREELRRVELLRSETTELLIAALLKVSEAQIEVFDIHRKMFQTEQKLCDIEALKRNIQRLETRELEHEAEMAERHRELISLRAVVERFRILRKILDEEDLLAPEVES